LDHPWPNPKLPGDLLQRRPHLPRCLVAALLPNQRLKRGHALLGLRHRPDTDRLVRRQRRQLELVFTLLLAHHKLAEQLADRESPKLLSAQTALARPQIQLAPVPAVYAAVRAFRGRLALMPSSRVSRGSGCASCAADAM